MESSTGAASIEQRYDIKLPNLWTLTGRSSELKLRVSHSAEHLVASQEEKLKVALGKPRSQPLMSPPCRFEDSLSMNSRVDSNKFREVSATLAKRILRMYLRWSLGLLSSPRFEQHSVYLSVVLSAFHRPCLPTKSLTPSITNPGLRTETAISLGQLHSKSCFRALNSTPSNFCFTADKVANRSENTGADFKTLEEKVAKVFEKYNETSRNDIGETSDR